MAEDVGGLPVRIVNGAALGSSPAGSAANPLVVSSAPSAPGGTEGGGTAAAPFVVAGILTTKTAEFTRPADVTAYAALDAVANSISAPTPLTFAALCRVAGSDAYVTKARLVSSVSTQTQRMRLHLYRATITAINDNSPLTVLYANRTNRIGTITFPALATEGTGSDCAYSFVQDLRIPVSSATTDVFGLLETLDAFTPGNAQTFFVALTADQN